MRRRPFGRTGLEVSEISFGASSLAGVFHSVDETEAIATVRAALDAGITYFDVAPAYGGTRAETVLGRALAGVPRDRFVLSTKAGKYTDPDSYGADTLDYSRARVRRSWEESAARLGVDHIDILYLHDIEYQGRRHTEWALHEGLDAALELKREGRVGAVGFGIYPVDLWERVLRDLPVDAALIHNHYCLSDARLERLLPLAAARGVGVVNASPFASGLLTERGPADWHPAGPEERAVFRRAAEFCAARGTSIAKLAFQFAARHPDVPTTMFSTANRASLARTLAWHAEPVDETLVAEVRALLGPVAERDWF
jgi:aryl-alcohol dehydrogenase-like predicted oxidoreductase